MPLSDEQRRTIEHAINMMEQSPVNYGEIRLIFKRPYWRHIQTVQAEDFPNPDSRKYNEKQDECRQQ
jgi:hypothetical protein